VTHISIPGVMTTFDLLIDALETATFRAQREGRRYVIFAHGYGYTIAPATAVHPPGWQVIGYRGQDVS
jgi:hypothetical protein